MRRESERPDRRKPWYSPAANVPDTVIAILQHGPDEAPGFIPEILREQGRPSEIVHLYKGYGIPRAGITGYVILGGQMSPGDEDRFPFLGAEKALIRSCLEDGTPVLGICLGAQLIAAAAGMRVFRGVREQGWSRVRPAGQRHPGLPEAPVVFQWHNDTFDLPPGATLVYTGDVIRNQMFFLGSCTGVQFHPEVTPGIIGRWYRGAGDDERRQAMEDTTRYMDGGRSLCAALLALAFREEPPV